MTAKTEAVRLHEQERARRRQDRRDAAARREARQAPVEEPDQPDLIDDIIAYESGAMGVADSVQFLARLFRAGFVPSLQGSYQRAVESLIRDGILSPEGEVLVDVEDA